MAGRWVILCSAVLVSGCWTNRYLLPLDGNPERAVAQSCADRCGVAGEDAEDTDFNCLASCPGVQIQHDKACSDNDVPRGAMCREDVYASGNARRAVVLVPLAAFAVAVIVTFAGRGGLE